MVLVPVLFASVTNPCLGGWTLVEGDGRGTWMSLKCVSETGTILPCFSLLMRVSCVVTTNVISIKKPEQTLNRKGRKHATTGRVDILRRSPTPFQDALAIVQSPESLVLARASCVAMQNLVAMQHATLSKCAFDHVRRSVSLACLQ